MVTADRPRTAPDYSEISQQHQFLREELEHLADVAAAIIAPLRDEQQDLRRRVELFHQRLRQHFELEEADGYLAYVREKRPGLRSFVDRLKDQHVDILSALASAGRDDPDPPSAEFRLRLTRALDLLRVHESEESELIQRALSEDIGSVD